MHICTYANKVFCSSHNDIIYLIKSHPVPSDMFCSLPIEISPLAMSDPYFELKINCQKKSIKLISSYSILYEIIL